MADDRELQAMAATLKALEPLETDEQQRVLDWLAAKLSLQAAPLSDESDTSGRNKPTSEGLGTIKTFLKDKNPADDVSRAAALAYYLTHASGVATYKTADLTRARIDAALSNFNMSRAVSNAQRAGYLTTAGKRGVYQITSSGESVVEAMPDADAIREAKAQGTKRRRKATGAKKTWKSVV